jgi:hypothetical protein
MERLKNILAGPTSDPVARAGGRRKVGKRLAAQPVDNSAVNTFT